MSTGLGPTADRPLPARVLVTGATGFVGRHFCERLVREGVEVRGLVRAGGILPPGVAAAQARGLDDRAGIRAALQGVEAVVHLAARVHVMRESESDPERAFERVNVGGTALLSDEAEAAGVRRFLFMSTVGVYGVEGLARLDESTPTAPSTPYGRTKLAAENLLRQASLRGSMRVGILRPPGVYGPGMKGNIPRLFRAVDRGLPVPAPATSNRRTLVYVGNLVDAGTALLRTMGSGGGTYLVGDAESLSTAELVREIAAALGRPARVLPLPIPALRLVGRLGDQLRRAVPFPIDSTGVDRLTASLVVDSSALQRDTGWRPRHSLAGGMCATAAWFRGRPTGSGVPDPC